MAEAERPVPGPDEDGFLRPYRVLDLTDHRGLMAGHMLAQLGADVIQVEPPGGSGARLHPPFAPDWPAPENSFFWAAYGAGKRSVTCDPSTPEGLDLFRRLLAEADFLIESFAPGEGRPDWISPAAIQTANPRLIHVSITPFGLDGPKAKWADSEIILWAAGGPLLPTRGADGQPYRISTPQAYLHAASDAASGALVAHFARLQSGAGQHVDVSVLQSVPQATLSAVLAAAVNHADYTPRPPDPALGTPKVAAGGGVAAFGPAKWPVIGGLAEMHMAIGAVLGASGNQVFAWMKEKGVLDPRFHDWNWMTLQARLDSGEITTDDVDAARAAVARLMAEVRKEDLMDLAMTRNIRVAPVQTIGDLIEAPHSRDRGFFQTVEGPFGAYVLPGNFAANADHGFVAQSAAPCLGADNAEVYGGLLGLSPETLRDLARLGAI
jgi:crotonobetainyl-CoA:carnitine CoA-transferase CaiB-like acyl-CoA transferase